MAEFCGESYLRRLGLGRAALARSGLSRELLFEVRRRHSAALADLDRHAEELAGVLRRLPEVHSVRTRIKDPDHLVAKIIRKRLQNPSLEITADSYPSVIGDLIGVRALHRLPEDWTAIHSFVLNHWQLEEAPEASVVVGDALEPFTSRGCRIRLTSGEYRSVHYSIPVRQGPAPLRIELQVRTLFEEAWCEVDHQVRYPSRVSEPYRDALLTLLHRLTRLGDRFAEMIVRLNVTGPGTAGEPGSPAERAVQAAILLAREAATAVRTGEPGTSATWECGAPVCRGQRRRLALPVRGPRSPALKRKERFGSQPDSVGPGSGFG